MATEPHYGPLLQVPERETRGTLLKCQVCAARLHFAPFFNLLIMSTAERGSQLMGGTSEGAS